MKKQLSFSNIKLKDLEQIVPIVPKFEERAFDKWFNYPYVISEAEEQFLKRIKKDRRLYLAGFSEEELKAKFIIPLLNKVDFTFEEISDWYERPLHATINEYELGGKTDFLVATGINEPKKPYFFIQEFKPSESKSSPQNQLLGELLVALHLNEEPTALGAYVVGQLWTFLLLEKTAIGAYTYYVSQGFNALNEEDLKRLYIALQGVKADIIDKIENKDAN